MSSRQQDEAGQRTRRRMLSYIAGYQDEHGWAPTVREIGDAMGLASPSSVQRHLVTLRNQGELVLGGGPRMIRLTGGTISVRPVADVIDHTVHHGSARAIDGMRLAMRDDGRLQPGR